MSYPIGMTIGTFTTSLIEQARKQAVEQDQSVIVALSQIAELSPEETLSALAQTFAFPFFDLNALQQLDADFTSIPYPECVRRSVLAASDAQGQVWVVITDPFDGDLEEWGVRRIQANTRSVVRIALTFGDTLVHYFSLQEKNWRALHPAEAADPLVPLDTQDELAAIITPMSIGEEKNEIVRLVNSTLHDALKLQASDIHLTCDGQGLHIFYRLDGVLAPSTQILSREVAEQAISRIKVMAELDIAEHRIPQDGRIKVRINGRDLDLRVSIMPSLFGEDAVLRLLDRQSLAEGAKGLRLDHLGLDPHTMVLIRRLANKPHGMMLITGPTGSGKTTTVYAALSEINTGLDKIITIEDPIEYHLPHVLQIPVNEKKGMTFARGLRSILRHDPDQIMVGEIRDNETAQIAIQAALTGHLVLTTVHANNVFDVLGRFLHMGVEAYSFAAALNGIVAQRLLRLNCPNCTKPTTLSPQTLVLLDLQERQLENWTPMAGQGCSLCRDTGYKGRKAVAEVLMLDDGLRELIAGQTAYSQLKAHAAAAGLKPLLDQALDLAARGETTLEEIARVASR